MSGGCGAKKWRARRNLLSKKKRMDGADGFFNYGRDNAAAAATTLTIRHSRFAALTLAKLVASLALHPPISATGSGGLRASSVSLFARHLLP